MDIQRKIDNIDEYVSYKVSQLATRLLDMKGKRVDNFDLNFEVLVPSVLRTEEVKDFLSTVKPELCVLKGYEPYDILHQQLFEKFGFNHTLPTFEEVRLLDKKIENLKSQGIECYSNPEYYELVKKRELCGFALGINSDQLGDQVGFITEMPKEIDEKYSILIQECSNSQSKSL